MCAAALVFVSKGAGLSRLSGLSVLHSQFLFFYVTGAGLEPAMGLFARLPYLALTNSFGSPVECWLLHYSLFTAFPTSFAMRVCSHGESNLARIYAKSLFSVYQFRHPANSRPDFPARAVYSKNRFFKIGGRSARGPPA